MYRVIGGLLITLFISLPQPHDITALSQYRSNTLSLFENTLLMSLIWSIYIVFYTSLYPYFIYTPTSILHETLPIKLHIIYTWISAYLWISCFVFIYNRYQIAIDTRKRGKWEIVSNLTASISSNKRDKSQDKVDSYQDSAEWKPNTLYKYDTVVVDSVTDKNSVIYYRCISPTSIDTTSPFHKPKLLLAFRMFYYDFISNEVGFLHCSRFIHSILCCLLIENIVIALIVLHYVPNQVSII
jgi:hypothetical protein